MTAVAGAITLVTGATGGIGAAVCRSLRDHGAEVIGADLHGADLDLDVTDHRAVDDAIGSVVTERGRIDVVVTAAGIGVAGLAETIPIDDWRRSVEVNLMGTINVVHAAYPRMIERGRGHLVLLASLSGLVPTPLLVPYSTTKAAVVGLASALRPEAALHGIGVTAVCPGPVDTRMLDDGGADGAVHGIDVRRYLTAAAGPAISPDDLAAALVRGIERDRPLVTPGRARLLALGARLSPGITAQIVTRTMRRSLP